MSSEPRYYVREPNDAGWANIGDRECTVYGEPLDHASCITVYGHMIDGVNTGHRYAEQIAAILNGAPPAPAVVSVSEKPATDRQARRQAYKEAALQGLCAAMSNRDNIVSDEAIAIQCGIYADAMLAEDEEHGKK